MLSATWLKLTTHFYDRMFTHHPELKYIFNIKNQRYGDQRQALFDTIYAYVNNVENWSALLPAVAGHLTKTYQLQQNSARLV